MATYVITNSPDIPTSENPEYVFKYRYKSSKGLPVAQDEMNRRQESGEIGFLWRWENHIPTMIEQV